MRAFVGAAARFAAKPENADLHLTPMIVLENIIDAKFTVEMQDGRTLISTSEAGGTATFAMMGSFTPIEVVAFCEDGRSWLASLPDPANPPAAMGRVIRLRASFAKATI